MTNNPNILPAMPPPPPHWVDADKLLAPPVPTGKHIYVFGTPLHRNHLEKLKQDEAEIKEKNSVEHIETRVEALKQLNKTLLVKFLQLTQTITRSPSEYESKIKEIKTLLMNMQHLLNLHRPHEARETIINMLEKQLERRKNVLEILQERIKAANDKLEDAKSRLSKKLDTLETEEIPPVETFDQTSIIPITDKPLNTTSLRDIDTKSSQMEVDKLDEKQTELSAGLTFFESVLDHLK